jgi:hypothetical protein
VRVRRFGVLALAIPPLLLATAWAASVPASAAQKPPPKVVYHSGQRCSASKEATYRRAGFTCYKRHLYRLVRPGYLKVGAPCTPKQELGYEANGFACRNHKLVNHGRS